MSLDKDENFNQSLPLPNSKNPDLQICGFSLDDTFNSESPGYSCSLSFPSVLSEPPDIRNFFSSYIYESPDLDTGEDFSHVAHEESEIDKAPVSEDIDSAGKTEFGAHRTCNNIDSSFNDELSIEVDTKWQNHSPSPAKDKCNLIVTCIGENKSLEHKQLRNHDLVHIENDGKSGSCDEDALRKLDEEFSGEGDHTLSKTSIKYGTSDKQESLERRSLPIEAGHDADSRETNGASSKKVQPCSSSEEEKIKNTTMIGFVSTKKYSRSENNGCHLKRSQDNRVEHKRKAVSIPPVERRPLVEQTNLLNKTVIPEVAGKWLCPQKSKPDLGPPTKQLRLDRWIHRL